MEQSPPPRPKSHVGIIFHVGRNLWDTIVGGHWHKHKFHREEIVFMGNMSSPGLTLKLAARSLKMVPLDRTHTTFY